MSKVKGNYETIMIFNTQLGEEGIKALAEKFQGLIKDNGTLDKVEDWGKRRLAYPIEDEIEGYYYLVEFTCDPDFPAELDRVYKITDGVLRTLIVCKVEEDKKPEKAVPAAPAAVEAPAPVAEAPAAPAAPAPAETTEG